MRKNILIMIVVIMVICGTSIWIGTDFFNQNTGLYYSAAINEDFSVNSAKLHRLLDNCNLTSIIEEGSQIFSNGDIAPAGLVGPFNPGLEGSSGEGSLDPERPGDFLLTRPDGFFLAFDKGQSGNDECGETNPCFFAGLQMAAFGGLGGGPGNIGGGSLLGGVIPIESGTGERLPLNNNGSPGGTTPDNDNPGGKNPPGDPFPGNNPPVPVPEPIILLLLGVGLVGVAVIRHKNRC